MVLFGPSDWSAIKTVVFFKRAGESDSMAKEEEFDPEVVQTWTKMIDIYDGVGKIRPLSEEILGFQARPSRGKAMKTR